MSREIPLTTAEMRRRIAAKFGGTKGNLPVPDHLCFYEVQAKESTVKDERWSRRRRIDVVAVGLLHRTDYLIHGFEIKVSRADLRQELKDPAKAAAGSQYCDRWWLALADPAIIRDGDPIPPEWGILVPHTRGLKIAREPQPLERVESPMFRAALLHAGARSPSYRYAMGYQAGLQKQLNGVQTMIDDAFRRGQSAGRWQVLKDLEDLALDAKASEVA